MYRTLTNKELLSIVEKRQNDPIYNEIYTRLEKLINAKYIKTNVLECPNCYEQLRVDLTTTIDFNKNNGLLANTLVKLF